MASPQASQRRRTPRRRDARRAILDATQALLLAGGEAGFSIRRVSERCGYGAPTIYHYFGDKRGLIDALLEQRFRALVERLERVPLGHDPVANLRALSLAFANFGRRNPRHYAMLSAPRQDGGAPPESAERARRMLEGPLAELAAAGRLVTPDLEAAQQSLWVFLHGFVSLRVSRPELGWSPHLLEIGLDALLRGLVRSGPSRRSRK